MTDKNTAAQTKSPASEAPVRADPFAGLPTVELNEATVLDLSGLETSNPRKYAKVNEAAVASKMPIAPNWKHSNAMFIPGRTVKEFRAGSVFGTLVDLTKRGGKAGIASYELATELRRAMIGNKRSHYCEKLQPVGWAEGYINSAVTQGIIDLHPTKKAPALQVAAAEAAGKEEAKKAA